MSKRIICITAVAAMAAFACLGLTGCGIENMDEETRKSVGMGLGMLIILASGIGYFASGRYFGKKRQQAARRNKQRANSKKKKRR